MKIGIQKEFLNKFAILKIRTISKKYMCNWKSTRKYINNRKSTWKSRIKV